MGQTAYKETGNTHIALPYPDPRGLTLDEHRATLPDSLEIECTTDMQYLNQYFFIRQYVYQNDLKVSAFSGAEDDVDRRSHLIIARIGHFCIGGLRLTISKKNNPVRLTLERGDYRLSEYFPEMQSMNVCDVGRVAILPQYRDSLALKQMLQLAIEIAEHNECNYLFGASPPSLARLFQRTFKAFGYDYHTRPDIPMPTGSENPHLKLLFQIVTLKE